MTVAELINKLRAMPQDLRVVVLMGTRVVTMIRSCRRDGVSVKLHTR